VLSFDQRHATQGADRQMWRQLPSHTFGVQLTPLKTICKCGFWQKPFARLHRAKQEAVLFLVYTRPGAGAACNKLELQSGRASGSSEVGCPRGSIQQMQECLLPGDVVWRLWPVQRTGRVFRQSPHEAALPTSHFKQRVSRVSQQRRTHRRYATASAATQLVQTDRMTHRFICWRRIKPGGAEEGARAVP